MLALLPCGRGPNRVYSERGGIAKLNDLRPAAVGIDVPAESGAYLKFTDSGAATLA